MKKVNNNVYYLIRDNEVISHFEEKPFNSNNLKLLFKHDKAIYHWLKQFEKELPLQYRVGDNFDNYVDFNLNKWTGENPKEINQKYIVTAKYWDKKLNRYTFSLKSTNIGMSDHSSWADKNFLNGHRITWCASGYLSVD